MHESSFYQPYILCVFFFSFPVIKFLQIPLCDVFKHSLMPREFTFSFNIHTLAKKPVGGMIIFWVTFLLEIAFPQHSEKIADVNFTCFL